MNGAQRMPELVEHRLSHDLFIGVSGDPAETEREWRASKDVMALALSNGGALSGDGLPVSQL
jgi:hypothetical protein